MPRAASFSYRQSIGIGITTLVTVFMVLLLTTFSVLTMVSARYDLNLSSRTVEATTSYYAVDQEACQWVGEIQVLLATRPQSEWSTAINESALDVSTQIEYSDDGNWAGITVDRQLTIDQWRLLNIRLFIDDDGQIYFLDWRSSSINAS